MIETVTAIIGGLILLSMLFILITWAAESLFGENKLTRKLIRIALKKWPVTVVFIMIFVTLLIWLRLDH